MHIPPLFISAALIWVKKDADDTIDSQLFLMLRPDMFKSYNQESDRDDFKYQFLLVSYLSSGIVLQIKNFMITLLVVHLLVNID